MQNVRFDQVVGISKNVSCSDDSTPWNLGTGQSKVIAELIGRFAFNTISNTDEIELGIFHRKLERFRFGQCAIPDDRMKATACDEINRRMEQIAQVDKERTEIKDVSAWFQIHKQVNIAAGTVLTSRNRAKDPHIGRTVNTSKTEYGRPLLGLKNLKCHRGMSLLCNSHEGGVK